MEIEPITKQNLEICVDIIFESELGRRYYPTRNLLKNKIEQSYLEDSIYLAKDKGDSVGVLWYQRKGMFCQYPYLHIIVLTESWLPDEDMAKSSWSFMNITLLMFIK